MSQWLMTQPPAAREVDLPARAGGPIGELLKKLGIEDESVVHGGGRSDGSDSTCVVL
jgi:hypothetical protein